MQMCCCSEEKLEKDPRFRSLLCYVHHYQLAKEKKLKANKTPENILHIGVSFMFQPKMLEDGASVLMYEGTVLGTISRK